MVSGETVIALRSRSPEANTKGRWRQSRSFERTITPQASSLAGASLCVLDTADGFRHGTSMSERTPERPAGAREALWFYGPIAIVFGFVAQPLIRYVAPLYLLGLAAVLGLAIILMDFAFEVKVRLALFLFGITAVVLAGGLYILAPGITAGYTASVFNDSRCQHIQDHMLSGRPGRADDAAMFQALGCRPQGKDDVHWQSVAPAIVPAAHGPVASTSVR